MLAAQRGVAIKMPSGRGSAVSCGLSEIIFDSLTQISRAHITIFTWLQCDSTCAQKTYTAIYHIQNTPTEPSRLQVTPSQPLLAPQFLVPLGPLYHWSIHWTFTGVPWILLLFLNDDSCTRVTMCTRIWFGYLWSQIIHVVEKFRHVSVKSGGEWFRRFWNVFAQMFVFAVVAFSKCKQLYLNEGKKCYGRQIYAFNPHKMVKKCVMTS